MSLWVRNEKRLNTQCSKVISKDVRAVRSDCTTQEPRRAVRITRLLFEIPIFYFRRRRLERNSKILFSKIAHMEPKSTKNRCKINLGRFWALKAVSGTHRGALRTGPGRQTKDPGPILGRPGRAKRAWEPAKSLPRPVLGRSQTTPERSPSALGALSAVEHLRGTVLRCFCRVAQKLEA